MAPQDSPDFLYAHHRLVGQGWLLQHRPGDAPRYAVAYYRHAVTGKCGYLVNAAGSFQLQPLDLTARRHRSHIDLPGQPMPRSSIPADRSSGYPASVHPGATQAGTRGRAAAQHGA
jgi:hypothetical protein